MSTGTIMKEAFKGIDLTEGNLRATSTAIYRADVDYVFKQLMIFAELTPFGYNSLKLEMNLLIITCATIEMRNYRLKSKKSKLRKWLSSIF